jgi:GNAT superfamily N-acetyltransferase
MGHAHLMGFALLPSLRGCGLSKGLIEETISLARSLGAKNLSLGLYGSNLVARNVYHRYGLHLPASNNRLQIFRTNEIS